MTQERGFHMKPKNCRAGRHVSRRYVRTAVHGEAYLEERVLFFRLELVGPEEFESTLCLLFRQTLLRALEQLEHIVYDDGLQINLVLVVQILRAKLDLRRSAVSSDDQGDDGVASEAYLGHVHFRICRIKSGQPL